MTPPVTPALAQELARLDATAQSDLVRTREVSASELLDACLVRLEAVEPAIRALATVDVDAARARATAAPHGELAGVPFLVKDLLPSPGMRWSFGSRLFAANRGDQPSPFVDRLEAAGLVTFGKTTTSEFGLLGSTETLLDGPTHNPWDLTLSAAGSSGGSAAAVAAGIVPVAHASDGGGSIRIPASVCGLFGLKPSRGRGVPTTAAPAQGFADLIIDHCISRSVRDSARLLSLTEADDDSAPWPPIGMVTGPSAKRLRIGAWTTTLLGREPEADVRIAFEATMRLCIELGHDVVDAPPPHLDALALSDGFFGSAAASIAAIVDTVAPLLGRAIGPDDLEPFTLELIERHRRAPIDPARVRADFERSTQAYLAAVADYDVVLTPTLATRPWKIGHLSPLLDAATLIERTQDAVGYTPIHNIAGCPAMSVPLHWTDDGVPIGMHFAAMPGDEATLLHLAYELEAAQPWNDRWAPHSYVGRTAA